MQGFRQNANTLLWEGNYEKLLIEPWGPDSLRVRSSVATQIRDDLFSVLSSPAATDVQIGIGDEGATIRNGAITASVSPEGYIRFSRSDSGAELLAEELPLRSTRIPPRVFKAVHSDLFQLEARFKAYAA